MKEPKIKFFDWVKIFCLCASILCLVFIFIKTGVLQEYDLSPYWFILTPIFAIIAAIPYRKGYWKDYCEEKRYEEFRKKHPDPIEINIRIS